MPGKLGLTTRKLQTFVPRFRGSGYRGMVAMAAQSPSDPVLVIGGGMAGLGAALVSASCHEKRCGWGSNCGAQLQALTDAGAKVVLVEQGRGLGGRLCSRRGPEGTTFDHGAQYITSRGGAFDGYVARLEAEGLLHPWAAGRIGSIACSGSGQLDPATWQPYATDKRMLVGNPKNSAIGQRLAAMCGDRLVCHTALRAEALERCQGGWRLRVRPAKSQASCLPTDVQEDLYGEIQSRVFPYALTCMSGPSTAKLLRGVQDAFAAEAAAVSHNVCWALLAAFRQAGGRVSCRSSASATTTLPLSLQVAAVRVPCPSAR